MSDFNRLCMAVSLVFWAPAFAQDSFDLSLQELLNVEVTSVSKQRQPVSDAPAAIYVVTADDILRSGAASIPQALRDVPGLHVAQIDSQKWAISSRGFNGRYNNKLLVMMDGRTLYSPEFSGVYWEVQDYLMADIERIEIIRGPGAALWGANAVNGVINIVTKHSSNTQGGYAQATAGSYEKGSLSLRYGGQLNDGTSARGYLKGFSRDSLSQYPEDMDPAQGQAMLANGVSTRNDWRQLQTGGRLDSQLDAASTLTLSGDVYRYRMHQVYRSPDNSPPYYERYFADSFDAEGLNLLGRYTRALSATSEFSLQAYYDRAVREEALFGFRTDTADLDFQHLFEMGNAHSIAWGLGYRHIEDELDHSAVIFGGDDSIGTDLWSAFIRDEVTLVPHSLWLTLAARVENGTFSGTEWQPNARIMWRANEQHRLWSSIAYAVRTPSRVELTRTIHASTRPPDALVPFPVEVWVVGNEGYGSESLWAYELGHRYSPNASLSFDTALYYNDYSELRGAEDPEPGSPTIIMVNNAQQGYSYGAELSAQWRATDDVRLRLNYSYSDGRFDGIQAQNTLAPQHIVSLNGEWAVRPDLSLNATWRHVSDTNVIAPSRAELQKPLDGFYGVDIGAHWKPMPDLTLSLLGLDLFYGDHVEYEAEQFHIPYRVGPSVLGKLSLQF